MPVARTRIKICGITNAEDARTAADYGADLLGFIFVAASKRYVGDDATVRRLLDAVPPAVWRVGVFDAAEPLPASANLLHGIQYYRPLPDDSRSPFSADRPVPFPIRAYRVKDESSLREIEADASPRSMILLDTYSAGALGGTGHTFDWELAKQAKAFGLPIILAGGLTPENVGEAVAAVRPYAVDVASGVEAAPGRKDHDKLRRFIDAVREADRSLSRADA